METSSERLERLLTHRLDELARALDRAGAPAPAIERLLGLAAAGTLQAVALELLSAERADGIWEDAKRRHPLLEEAELPLPERRAA